MDPYQATTLTTLDRTILTMHLLKDLGMPANLQGYQFLRDAISMAHEDQELLHPITHKLYQAIAQKHGSTQDHVQRNMRTALKVIWRDGNKDEIAAIFGYGVMRKGPVTPSAFISRMVEELELKKLRDGRGY